MDEENRYQECEYCGTKDETVEITNDPFIEEIHGKQVSVCICSKCYQQSCMDI